MGNRDAMRAMRHLQRARELLGFGYTDSSHETRYTMQFGVHEQTRPHEQINDQIEKLEEDNLPIVVGHLGCDRTANT
jgi:hypothetical protein